MNEEHIKKIKMDDIDLELNNIIKLNEDKNIIIYDFVTPSFYIKEKKSLFKISPTISLNSLLTLGLTFEKESIIIQVRPDFDNRENKVTYPNLYIRLVTDYKKDEAVSFEEKMYKFQSVLRIDPLNIRRLQYEANELNLTNENKELAELILYSENNNNNLIESSYSEVIRVVQHLNNCKYEENSYLFESKLNTAYSLFNKYFQTGFDYGVVVLGTYISSLLGSYGKLDYARDVYSKTELFLSKNYDNFSKMKAKLYKEILVLKSGSVFKLNDYLKVIDTIEVSNKLNYFVLNINLLAKYIANNQFQNGQKQVNEINDLLQNIPDLLNNIANESGVKYQNIYTNNRIIVEYANGDIKLDDAISELQKIRSSHAIFNINLLALMFIQNQDITEEIKEMEYCFNKKLKDDFYAFYVDLLKILNERRYEDVEQLKKPSLLEVDNLDVIEDMLKKIKSLGESTDSQTDLNETVKTLLIDFNIWDYLNVDSSE